MVDPIASFFGPNANLYEDVFSLPQFSEIGAVRSAYFSLCLTTHPDKIASMNVDKSTAENRERAKRASLVTEECEATVSKSRASNNTLVVINPLLTRSKPTPNPPLALEVLRKFYAISATYDVLSDPERKSKYDSISSQHWEQFEMFGNEDCDSISDSEDEYDNDEETKGCDGVNFNFTQPNPDIEAECISVGPYHKKFLNLFRSVYTQVTASAPQCVRCGKNPVAYETVPCGCMRICKSCAMKVATGGKCRECGKFFVQCRMIRK
jgi:hypothetical protein